MASLPNPDRPALEADGILVEGNLIFGFRFSARGEVRLIGAVIRRNLDCAASSFSNPGGYSPSAAGACVDGTVYFCETEGPQAGDPHIPFEAVGTLRLDGAKIAGDLDFSGAKLVASAFVLPNWSPREGAPQDPYALTADGLLLGANALLCDGFKAEGAVSLINAKIGNDLNCRGASFSLPGEDALSADGAVVAGTTFFNEESTTDGMLRFVLAELQNGLQIEGMTFRADGICQGWFSEENVAQSILGGPATGLYGRGVEITGGFIWHKICLLRPPGLTKDIKLWLSLLDAKLDSIRDDQVSWDHLDHYELGGCTYGNIES
jgi:hypothetical protein